MTIPGNGGDEEVDIPVVVSSNTGTVTVNIDEETLKTLIENALVQDGEVPTVTLDLSGVENATAAVLTVEAAQTFSEAGVAVTLKLPDAEITLNLDALGAIASEKAGSFTVEAAVVPMSNLRGMQAAQVKGYETVVSIDIFVGDEKVDVPLTVSLPYNLKPNENPAAVTVWHLDDNGVLTKLGGIYDRTTGMITFTIDHQSYFVVGYDPVTLWVNTFSDVNTSAWYFDAVAYANYYSLFQGYGNGIFAPQDNMTRAMFVTVLWNMEGKPAPNGGISFNDVSANAWYRNAVLWAAESDIAGGAGNGNFSPDRAITRQEMAVMLYNYANNYKKYAIPVNRSMPDYADQVQIASWAVTAVMKLSDAGVLSGDTGFRPEATSTRAEVAQMFKNFMRFIADNQDGANNAPLATVSVSGVIDYYFDKSAMEALKRALAVADDNSTDL